MHITSLSGPYGVVTMGKQAFASVSDTCIIPMQDVLGLGAESRMNFPGTLSDYNWTWRTKDAIIYQSLAKRIRDLTNSMAASAADE